MKHVVITDCDHGDVDRELALLAPHARVTVADCRTEEEVLAVAADADAIICQYAPISARVLAGLRRCRVVVRYGIGYDTIDATAATAYGIPVCNVPDYCVAEVADHALALALLLLRGIGPLARSVRAGEWDYRAAGPLRRTGTLTVGVVGYGRIGAAFAGRVRALGATVLAADPRPLPDDVPQVPLDELLSLCDLVSLHVPGGGVILGEREFGLMRPGSCLVNVSRGSLVDERALLGALDRGVVRGAALDVLHDEPPSDRTLVTHERVVVTPHSAWYSEEALHTLKDSVALEVLRVLRGEAPRNAVNRVPA
ncbi:dehydrogenase [Virgisporangium aliadipatigenens]|uniref:Dehydrogenase n=1 Tax=Virgisporangium aliadipatigenens TaxID=741659 RepID=A0A8J3YJW3_9ACTN|nr:C-terminal binding protein [Virgisporangium aliadipatigenens]GIJ45365.1 dehydrogenase [Virgisporangium aliadipatigenens]